MARILLVEDDQHLRFGIAFNLNKEGHEVIQAGTAEEAKPHLKIKPPDLLLLDLMLPGQSGFLFLEELRRDGHSFPVMMLTARSDESDAVTALSLGADDYVRKPFGLAELTARIAAILRRGGSKAAGEKSAPIRIGKKSVDLQNLRIFSDEGDLAMTGTEVEILSVMLESAGQVIRREDLLRRIWGIQGRSLTRTLDNHVARLRKKLEDDPADPRHLLTIHGVGYKLLAGS